MIYSMTGYGKCEKETDRWHVRVEVRSVNHRFCDISLNIPQCLAAIDYKIRQQVKQTLGRGKVDVLIRVRSFDEVASVSSDIHLADAYVREFNTLRERYSCKDSWRLSDLLMQENVLFVNREEGDDPLLFDMVLRCCDNALCALNEVRAVEGEYLRNNLCQKISAIQKDIEALSARMPEFQKEYMEKLRTRIHELIQGHLIGEERLATEVALMADKTCVDEEIVRLSSHCQQLRALLNGNVDQVGRRADFILQELQREANTILSKATDTEMTGYGIDMKSLIEQMREQVQNLL